MRDFYFSISENKTKNAKLNENNAIVCQTGWGSNDFGLSSILAKSSNRPLHVTFYRFSSKPKNNIAVTVTDEALLAETT